MIEVGQGKVVMLSSFVNDDMNLPEYYYKDKHDKYHLYEHSKELQELVTKYTEVNG